MVLTYEGTKMLETTVDVIKALAEVDTVVNKSAGHDILRVGIDNMGRAISLGKSKTSEMASVGKRLQPDGEEWWWGAGDYKPDLATAKAEYERMIAFEIWIASEKVVE